MMRRKKIKWKANDVFVIPLNNGQFTVGHVLDQSMPNTVRVALYAEVIDSIQTIEIDQFVKNENLISLIEVSKEQLDFSVWPIIGNKVTDIPISRFPNEQFRVKKWVGAKMYDAGLAEDFVNAYYALAPWDQFYNADYLDGFLVDISKKPKNLILIKG